MKESLPTAHVLIHLTRTAELDLSGLPREERTQTSLVVLRFLVASKDLS